MERVCDCRGGGDPGGFHRRRCALSQFGPTAARRGWVGRQRCKSLKYYKYESSISLQIYIYIYTCTHIQTYSYEYVNTVKYMFVCLVG